MTHGFYKHLPEPKFARYQRSWVSKRHFYCSRLAGLVLCFKIGRAVRLWKSELDAALERMRMGQLG